MYDCVCLLDILLLLIWLVGFDCGFYVVIGVADFSLIVCWNVFVYCCLNLFGWCLLLILVCWLLFGLLFVGFLFGFWFDRGLFICLFVLLYLLFMFGLFYLNLLWFDSFGVLRLVL